MRYQERVALYWLGGILLGLFLLPLVVPLITPFLLAFIFSAIIDPFVNTLEYKGVPRGIAVFVAGLFLILALVFLIGIGYIHLSGELQGLVEQLPPGESLGQRIISAGQKELIKWSSWLPEPIYQSLEQALGGMSGVVEIILREGWDFLQLIPGFFATTVIALLATFFISRDNQQINKVIKKVTPAHWHHKLIKARDEMLSGIMAMVRAQLILISITTIITIIGLNLIGLPYAGLLGILAGFLDLLPIVGPGMVLTPIAIFYLLGNNVLGALATIALMFFVFTIRQLAEPRIVGKCVGIHPLAILIGVYVGAKLLGVEGFILGPLAIIVLRALFLAQNGINLRP